MLHLVTWYAILSDIILISVPKDVAALICSQHFLPSRCAKRLKGHTWASTQPDYTPGFIFFLIFWALKDGSESV